MKIIIVFAFLSVLFVICGQAQDITNQDSVLINAVLHNKFEQSHVKSDIDKALLKDLKKRNGRGFTLANPKEAYNSTDMIVRGFPNKRLLVLGKSAKKDLGFILYEIGEFTGQNCCLIYKKKERKIYMVTVLVLDKSIETLEQLRTSIQDNKYYIL